MKRDEVLFVRVNAVEAKRISKAAKTAGLPVATYVRMKLLEVSP